MTHKQYAGLLLNLYAVGSQFDEVHITQRDGKTPVEGAWAAKKLDVGTLLAFRGSYNVQDWVRDFDAVPKYDPHIGMVHMGFNAPLPAIVEYIIAHFPEPYFVTGHSLGGAEASCVSAHMIARGKRVIECVVFGEPNSNFMLMGKVNQLIAQGNVIHASYVNMDEHGHDVVTDVPTKPPFDSPSIRVRLLCHPPDDDSWGPFAYHHMELYYASSPN